MNNITELIKQSVANGIIKHLKSFASDIKNKFYNKTEIE